jgi:hypothetical protein
MLVVAMFYLSHPPAKTFDEPEIISPLSVESPILASGIPLTKTLLEPTLITAECGTQDGPDGIVCGATGFP